MAEGYLTEIKNQEDLEKFFTYYGMITTCEIAGRGFDNAGDDFLVHVTVYDNKTPVFWLVRWPQIKKILREMVPFKFDVIFYKRFDKI